MIGLYEDALVYDVLHAAGTRAEIGVVERLARRRGALGEDGRGVFMEPACGTGRYLRVLAGRGHPVIGFDRSAAMVAFARERLEEVRTARASRGRHGRAARARARARARASPERLAHATHASHATHPMPIDRVFVADMTGFGRRVAPGSVDVALNLINTIRHLGTDRAMLAHFRAVARALRPRGVYVVGLTLSDYGNEFETEDVWWGSRGGAAGLRVQQVIQYLPPSARGRREWVHSHLTITRGRREEHRDSKYWLRSYSREEWLGLIGRSALKLDAVADAAGRRREMGVSGYALYVLKRRRGEEWE